MANHACILPGETKELECRLSDEENTLSGCSVVPALSMVNGLVAPDAVYFTSTDDGICWLRVTNEGAAAMEFDSADELFTGQVLTSGDMLSMEELQQKPELMLELSESDRALVAAFDLSESRRPANEAAGREGTSDASVGGRANSESVLSGSNFAFAAALPRQSVRSAEPDVLPELHNATFEQWLANVQDPKYTITRLDDSVWARDDVLPSVVFCGGMGGVSTGSIVRRDGKYVITALVIECDPEVCQTHRLNNPSVPVLQQRIVNANETKHIVARFLPRSHWRRAWFHSSNSCKKASTANMTGRDIGAALSDTIFYIQMMEKLGPAIWTLENVSELHQFFRGKYPTAHVFSMKQHCRLAQDRRRMVLSNRTLLLNRTTEVCTVRDVLGEKKGWEANRRYWMRNAWGYVRDVDSSKGSYSITSGHLQAGASDVGEFGPQHVLTSDDRALLQGYDAPPVWPRKISEGKRRAMVAQVVPPPFAEQLSISVFGYQVSALERMRVQARLALLAGMTEDEVVGSKFELSSTWLSDVDDSVFLSDDFGATDFVKKNSQAVGQKIGKHGRWKSIGEYGWCKASIPEADHIDLIRVKPWLLCTKPPTIHESFTDFRSRREREKMARIQVILEQAQMESEDIRRNGGESAARRLSHHFINVAPEPNQLFSRDLNSEAASRDPAMYGPYLAEGESYKTPRTPENVAAACKAMGLDDLPEKDRGERKFYVDLVYELWVLFDDKLRAIAGVEIDLDLGDVKPIRAHPYRWSPAKVQAGRELVQEFLDDGIVRPITSEWGAPALLVPKPKGGWRLVIDLRELNKHIPHDVYEPPSCDLCLEWLAGKPYRTTADMRWGFHQVLLSERAQKIFTFVTPFGTFAYQRLVMGYVNATAEFQRHMNNTLGPLLWDTCLSMVDDLCIASETKEEHRVHVTSVLTSLAQRHHSIKPSKMHILRLIIEYLGHMPTPDGTMPTSKHVEAIINMPPPLGDDGLADKTMVRSLIGMIKYIRRYIPKCGLLCDPLNQLCTDDSDRVWSPVHAMVLARLKYIIAITMGVKHADFKKPLYICSDGSKRGIGGYLFQKGADGEERIISYFSRSTTKDERKWDTRELEVLAMIATLEYFRHYIDGQPVHLDTDHQNITWLSRLRGRSDRLGRWVLRLSEFNATIKWRKGIHMHIADCMSRNSQPGEVDDDEVAKVCVPVGEMLVTELNPGDAGFAPTFESVNYCGVQEFSRVPMVCMVEFDMADPDERRLQADVALQQERASRHIDVEGGINSSIGGEDDLFEFDFNMSWPSVPSREGTVPPSPSREGTKTVLRAEADGGESRQEQVVVGASAEDAEAAERSPLQLPESLIPEQVSIDVIRKEQRNDPFSIDLLSQLEKLPDGEVITQADGRTKSGRALRLSKFAALDGVLFRVTEASDPKEGYDSARCYVPVALRKQVIRTMHSSAFGAHRNETATHKELVVRYYWPRMDVDVHEFVRDCVYCELAKGTKPSRQGFLQGWRHNTVMNMICMDLVGPIGSRESGHVAHKEPLHLLVITDPFSHMVWIEPITGKSAEEVYTKFVEGFLLEEGAPLYILTDNGREFDNKLLKELLRLLKIRLYLTPAYHPRGNYTERVNRFIGESLRTMLSMPGAKKADWWKLAKFIQFAYRRMLIPGTNVSPYMVARGRQPSLPSDLERFELGDALPTLPALSDHVKELTGHMKLASRLLREARERTLARSREAFNEHQVHTQFEPGERVRLWKRVAIRRKVGSDEISSKLKIFNTVYVVVSRQGNNYTIRDVISGKETVAHVSQIARMRSPVGPEESEEVPALTQNDEQVWDRLKEGTYCIIWLKTEEKSILRVLEVLEVVDGQQLIGWHYIHRAPGAFNPELPLAQRRLMPEWAHLRTQQRARPKRGTEDQYEKILGEYSFGEFMLVAAGFHMQSDGKVPTPVCARADAWLRRVASSSPRAVLGISEPTEAELKKQAAFQGKARAKVVVWVT